MNQKYKYMTLDERIEIQECLNKGMTFKAIAQRIGKDQTTISKEVKKHLIVYTNSFTKTDECCPKLLRAPFVAILVKSETIEVVSFQDKNTQRSENFT